MLISSLHPWLYNASIFKQRFQKSLTWHFKDSYSKEILNQHLPYKIFKHQSVLIRQMGDSDIKLQYNKVQNLQIAIKYLDGIVIRPGETFSFWKLVGKPSEKRGFVEGMLLANGDVRVGVGGGLCQLANLIYWMALHSPLEITQRFHHGFDPFPDSGRTIPFGTGATIFYNFIDLQIYNPTDQDFQFNIFLTDKYLKGVLYSSALTKNTYSIEEQDHHFLFDSERQKYFRTNKIFRKTFDRGNGNLVNKELISDNFCEMKYSPPVDAEVLDMENYLL